MYKNIQTFEYEYNRHHSNIFFSLLGLLLDLLLPEIALQPPHGLVLWDVVLQPLGLVLALGGDGERGLGGLPRGLGLPQLEDGLHGEAGRLVGLDGVQVGDVDDVLAVAAVVGHLEDIGEDEIYPYPICVPSLPDNIVARTRLTVQFSYSDLG